MAATLALRADGSGRARVALAIPDVHSLVGQKLATQVSVVDHGAASSAKLITSNALETTLGDDR